MENFACPRVGTSRISLTRISLLTSSSGQSGIALIRAAASASRSGMASQFLELFKKRRPERLGKITLKIRHSLTVAPQACARQGRPL